MTVNNILYSNDICGIQGSPCSSSKGVPSLEHEILSHNGTPWHTENRCRRLVHTCSLWNISQAIYRGPPAPSKKCRKPRKVIFSPFIWLIAYIDYMHSCLSINGKHLHKKSVQWYPFYSLQSFTFYKGTPSNLI